MRAVGLIWVLCASALGFLGGCEGKSAPPRAAEGSTKVTPRLAVLSPALAETLRELGAGDLIVARHGWDSFTPGSVPPVGNESGIDYEAVLKCRPTAVVMQAGAKEVPARLRSLGAEYGWKIVQVPALTLDDVISSIGVLARLANVPHEREEVLRSSFRGAMAPLEGAAAKAGRVLILSSVDPPAVMGPGSFHFEMVEKLGADAIPDEGAPFIQWSAEDVLKADPDTLVLMLPGAASENPEENLGPLAKLGLRAVKRGAVVVVTDAKAQLPASSLSAVARRVAMGFGALPPVHEAPRGAEGTAR